MRRAVVWLALILLHGPDGHPVWIVPSQVVSVEPFEDPIGTHTLIKTLAGDRYVAECAEDVAHLLQASGCKE